MNARMAQQGCNTIRMASSRCLDLFVRNLNNETAVSAMYETMRGSLEDEYGRFKLWGSNIGVFANVHSSLDFRLREIPDVAELFLRQLVTVEERLEQVLHISLHTFSGDKTKIYGYEAPHNCPECEQVFTLPSDMRKHLGAVHSIDQSSGDESQGNELNTNNYFGNWSNSELLQSIHESIDWLHRLSNMVRKASFGRQNRRANDFMVRDETGKKSVELTQSLLDGLRHLYRHYISTHAAGVGDQLAERLVQTMIIRHKRILYRRARREAWKLEEGVHAPVKMNRSAQHMDNMGVSLATPKTTTSKKMLSLDLQQPTKTTGRATSQTTSKVTATTLDVSMIRKAVPRSEVSRATSNSLYVADWVLLPPRPSKAKLGKEFVCDYCGLLLEARQASNMRVWADHVRKDLDPYVCVFDECDTPYEIFSSSREWLAHMRSKHRMRWHCFATTHEPSSFESPDALEDHLRETHTDQLSDEEISFLAENSGHPMDPVIEHCPFCQDKAENTEEHVARHLIQFALRSLPLPDDCSDDHQTGHTSHSGHSDGPASSSEAGERDGDGDEMPDMRKADWDAWEEEIQAGISSSDKNQDEKQEDSSFIGAEDDVVGLQDFMAPDYNIAEDLLLEPFRRRASLAHVADTSYKRIPENKKTILMRTIIFEETKFVRVLQVLARIYSRTPKDAFAIDETLLEQLYSNMDHLAYLHQRFLNDLQPTVFFDWSLPTSIGDVFLNNLRKMDPAHHQYAKIHDRATQMWKSARENSKNQDWIKQCDQISQDEIGREHPHIQFEHLEELVNGEYWSELYETWLSTLSRQTPSDNPDKGALLSASEYHRESVLRLEHMQGSEKSRSEDVNPQTVLIKCKATPLFPFQLEGEVIRQDIEFTKLFQEFGNDHQNLEAVSEQLKSYFDNVKKFRSGFKSYVEEIENFMGLPSRPSHQEIRSKWIRFSTAYHRSPVDLQEMQGSNTESTDESLLGPIRELLVIRTRSLSKVHHWLDRRAEFQRCKDIINNGYTLPEHLVMNYGEFEANQSVLREELPILHDRTSRLMALVIESLTSEQVRWSAACTSTMQILTARTDVPEWVEIVEDFYHGFGFMDSQVAETELAGSSQPRSGDSPTRETALELQAPNSPDWRSHYRRLVMDYDTESLGLPEAAQSKQKKNKPGITALWSAVSLTEFNLENTEHEAGYPYLFYPEQEIFDVISEQGELWLAVRRNDSNKEAGWIWSKHFAKVSDLESGPKAPST